MKLSDEDLETIVRKIKYRLTVDECIALLRRLMNE